MSEMARVPVSPLSMKNKELAMNNEILVDYDERQIYVHVLGEYYNITASVNHIIDEISTKFKTDQQMMLDIFKSEVASEAIGEVIFRTTNGEMTTLKDIISSNQEDITRIIESITDANGDITNVSESVSNLQDSFKKLNEELEKIKNTEVVSTEQINSWDSKSRVFTVLLTIPTNGWTTDSVTGEAPYRLTTPCNEAKSVDRPLIDIVVSDNADAATAEMQAFSNIYKATISDGFITFLAFKPIESSVQVQVKFDRVDPPAEAGTRPVVNKL